MILLIGSFPTKKKIFGGSTTAMGLLIQHLKENKIQYQIIDSTASGIPASPLLVKLKKGIQRLFQFLGCLINRNIDCLLIFHGHGLGFIEKGSYALLAKLTGKSVYIAPRSGLILKDLTHPLYRKFAALVFKKVDGIVCQSIYWKNCFNNLSQSANTKVIYNWATLPILSNTQHNDVTLKIDQLNLLYTGWLESWKGIETLLEAVSLIEKENKNIIAKLDIFGQGTLHEPFQKWVNQNHLNHKVIFHGMASKMEMEPYHLSSDIFILPSLAEGMPNALLEAMGYGETCISTNITSIPEIIQNGFNGILIAPNDSLAIKTAIENLAAHPELRKKLGAEARKHIQTHHQLDIQIEKLVTFCNKKVA